jgi:hypothetical protein
MPEKTKLSDDAFLEMRWRCLSLAADLDRLERDRISPSDPRLVKLREALSVLMTREPNRAERVQMVLSDLTPLPPYGKEAGNVAAP